MLFLQNPNASSYRSLTEALQDRVNADRHGITFILGEKDEYYFPYRKLYEESLYILHALQQQGLKPGDELILQLDNVIEFVHIFWACVLGGIIPVPIVMHRIESDRLLGVWKTLNDARIVVPDNWASQIESVLQYLPDHDFILGEIKKKTIVTSCLSQTERYGAVHKANPTDIAFLQFTSGATGNPKGVILTHENLLSNCNALINRFSASEPPAIADSTLSWLPLTHDMGLIGYHLLPIVGAGNQTIMPPELFVRSPQLWMEKTSEHKATILGGPNFSYHHFLKHFKPEKASHWSLDHVRVIFNGAEPISTSLLNRFLDTLAPYGLGRNVMILGYGLAEASVGATSGLLGEEFRTIAVDRSSLAVGQAIRELDAGQPNSVPFADLGYPFDDCQVRLVADDGNPIGDAIVGHIQIRGKNVTRGYYNNPEATREVMTEDGWLNTGDLGFMRGGRLVVTGRAKDIIFVYGKNYYAHDIEQIAQEVEGVEVNDVAACGSFNRELNKDEIILFVRYKGETDSFIPLAQKLKQHINQRIGIELDHSIPVKRMPKTTSGKIQRYILRDQYETGHFQALLEEIRSKQQTLERQKPILVPETEIEKTILNIWARVLQLPSDQISTEDPFLSIGGTSFKAMQMLYLVEEELGLKLGERILVECKTIKEMAVFIENGRLSAPSMGPDSEQDQTKANM
jgi:acyl-CoA synthetase (AMP-forming)/AMP-acid ligase II/acyl carrier protein